MTMVPKPPLTRGRLFLFFGVVHQLGVEDAIVERFGRGPDGTQVPITEGSTLPVVHRVAHAGIVETRRWSFTID